MVRARALRERTERVVRKALTFFLLTAFVAASLLLTARSVNASTFTVTNTNDSGPGSLRQAILDANARSGADTINFKISNTDCNATTGVCTISPTSALPEITDPVTINGYSQPGSKPNTLAQGNNAALKIELNGAGLAADGLVILAANSTVKGLVVNRFGDNGVAIGGGASGTKVQGNFIGTDASGTQDLGNSWYGVGIEGASNTVGETSAGAHNVISGNDTGGVLIQDFAGTGATGNKVQGNYIGTDASGINDLGNSFWGVEIRDAIDNTIGGTTAGARNVISGNNGFGVLIAENATGTKVQGNYIGTGKDGTSDLGNDFYGVYVEDSFDNTIGTRNVIAFNGADGVAVVSISFNSTGNRILSNSIRSNSGLGIDLGNDGITPNDTTPPPPDADDGPNALQNFPEITFAKPIKKKKKKLTAIKGTLNSTPNTTFTVQFFSNPELEVDPTGFGEGKKFIGQKVVTTDSSGNASFGISVARNLAPVRSAITGTATDPDGNTSEFSQIRFVRS